MSSYINVGPAYGRDYKSQKEVKEAWASGKDFVVLDVMHPFYGSYINKEDAEGSPEVKAVNIRYAQHAKLCVIKVH